VEQHKGVTQIELYRYVASPWHCVCKTLLYPRRTNFSVTWRLLLVCLRLYFLYHNKHRIWHTCNLNKSSSDVRSLSKGKNSHIGSGSSAAR